MATDLSKLIQDSFTLTLTGLLAKDAKIIQITKAHIRDLEETQIYKIDSLFNFSTLSSKFSFLVPAPTASLIFNTMMGSPITDLADEFDDDTEDAIGEFISNTSGSLTTALNGSEFEDIGQTKFNISHKEVIKGEEVTHLENTYKFRVDLEDHELTLFITFEEEMLPYIEEIAKSKITFYEPRKEPEEEILEDIDTEIKKDEETDTTKSTDNEETTPKNDKKLKKIILGVAAILGVIILLFLILLFTGFFDQEPLPEPKKVETTSAIVPVPVVEEKVEIVKYDTLQKVIFNTADINTERINTKLAELTKYKVLNKEELEAQQLAEKNRLFEREREKELLAFSNRNHEETIYEKQPLDMPRVIDKKTKFENETFALAKDDTMSVDTNTSTEAKKNNTTELSVVKDLTLEDNTMQEHSQLHYVVTNSLKYSLFKSLVQETTTTQARISICNNMSGKTTIYIGPFESESLQNTMITLVGKNDSQIQVNAENITEEEFNTRCNLE
ncbi:MAG: hypothetical protein WA945_06315 [Arcobacteraceae bacterium]